MQLIPVVYGEKMNAISGDERSPSAHKPGEFAKYLKSKTSSDFTAAIVEPEAMETADFEKCHHPEFVQRILNLQDENGFGTKSQSVVDSLPYTSGAMYKAAKVAYFLNMPTAALCSGFHHAGYRGFKQFGYFCTFNGLMATAIKLLDKTPIDNVAIIDCDFHDGNGTRDVLKHVGPNWPNSIMHFTFGQYYTKPEQAKNYLDSFDVVQSLLESNKSQIILYQAGADCHVDDPYGGIFTEQEMFERDVRMFQIAKDLSIPICWNLAGGYQIDEKTGGIDKVLNLHYNTFLACAKVYGK